MAKVIAGYCRGEWRASAGEEEEIEEEQEVWEERNQDGSMCNELLIFREKEKRNDAKVK